MRVSPKSKPESSKLRGVRCIAHIDLDCFYVQVERQRHPELVGKPCAVVQYNSFQGGGIIALSYEAKALGVKRSMRGEQAKEKCPEIQLITVDVKREKADLSVYREAGTRVFDLCANQGVICERVSIDEAYLDVTKAALSLLRDPERLKKEAESIGALDPATVVIIDKTITAEIHEQFWKECFASHSEEGGMDALLAAGAVVVKSVRKKVVEETGFTLSAGIAHNKMLAKLFSGRNKPNKQTIVPRRFVSSLLEQLPLRELNGFGGKLGDALIEKHNLKFVGDLVGKTMGQLKRFVPGGSTGARDNTAQWMYNACRGICNDQVKPRLAAKSASCGKTFRGPNRLRTLEDIKASLEKLAEELFERVQLLREQFSQIPQTFTMSFYSSTVTVKRKGVELSLAGGEGKTRSCPFPGCDLKKIKGVACALAEKEIKQTHLKHGVTSLYIGAMNFYKAQHHGIDKLFQACEPGPGRPPTSRTLSSVQPGQVPKKSRTAKEFFCPKKSTGSTIPTQPDTRVLWKDVDKEVFESLPEELKEELRSSLQRVPDPKRRKHGQRNMKDYFS